MNLIIDVGNSFVKIAVFQKDVLLEKKVVEKERFQREVEEFTKAYPKIRKAILSSVSEDSFASLVNLPASIETLVLGADTKLPFHNRYTSPRTLGNDRKALVAAAAQKYPHRDCLVIDAGTCITYDFKNRENEYLGGGISPGLQMRYRALHAFTAKLPQLEPQNEANLVGVSTKDSIHSGVILGMAKEIEGIIGMYQTDYEGLEIIFTGGDAHFLSISLKNSIFATSNFLLEGLNHILEFNRTQ